MVVSSGPLLMAGVENICGKNGGMLFLAPIRAMVMSDYCSMLIALVIK